MINDTALAHGRTDGSDGLVDVQHSQRRCARLPSSPLTKISTNGAPSPALQMAMVRATHGRTPDRGAFPAETSQCKQPNPVSVLAGPLEALADGAAVADACRAPSEPLAGVGGRVCKRTLAGRAFTYSNIGNCFTYSYGDWGPGITLSRARSDGAFIAVP